MARRIAFGKSAAALVAAVLLAVIAEFLQVAHTAHCIVKAVGRKDKRHHVVRTLIGIGIAYGLCVAHLQLFQVLAQYGYLGSRCLYVAADLIYLSIDVANELLTFVQLVLQGAQLAHGGIFILLGGRQLLLGFPDGSLYLFSTVFQIRTGGLLSKYRPGQKETNDNSYYTHPEYLKTLKNKNK